MESPLIEQVGCFQSFTVSNNATMSSLVHSPKSFCIKGAISVGWISGNDIA